MNKVNIKPLTVNQCWQGRRFKTNSYKGYEKILLWKLLPDNIEIPEGKLAIWLEFGISSANNDWDNPIKPFVDILQKKYSFNDNRIYYATVRKNKVKKGKEYVSFRILKYGRYEL